MFLFDKLFNNDKITMDDAYKVPIEAMIGKGMNFVVILCLCVIIVLFLIPRQNTEFGRVEKIGTYCKGTALEAYNYDYYKCTPTDTGMGCKFRDTLYMKNFFIKGDTCVITQAGSSFKNVSNLYYEVESDYKVKSSAYTIPEDEDCIDTSDTTIHNTFTEYRHPSDTNRKIVHVQKEICERVSSSKYNLCHPYNVNDVLCKVTNVQA